MQVNPIGGGAPPVPQQIERTPQSTAAGTEIEAGGEVRSSAAGQSSQAGSVSMSSSSLSIQAAQMTSSQRVSALITTFAPYAADQDMMKLLLLLIVLELLYGEDKGDQQSAGGGLLFFQSESTSSYQSLEITQSETNLSYGLSSYSQQSPALSGAAPDQSAAEADTGGAPGRNLDLQA